MQKLSCFDLDGTFTINSTWEAFNARLGITPEDDRRLFDLYLTQNLAYKDWIIELIKIYKENGVVHKNDLEDLAKNIELRPGAQELIADAKAKDYHVVLISGAVDVVVKILAAKLGIREWFATNKAVYDDEGNLVDIETMGDERDAKLLLLETFCLNNGYDLKETISAGDGGNDLEIFKHTKGILLGDNKELMPFAWKHVENLSEINLIL